MPTDYDDFRAKYPDLMACEERCLTLEEENERLRAEKVDCHDTHMQMEEYYRAHIEAALALHHEFRIYDECECPEGHAESDAGAVYVEEEGFVTCEKGYAYSVCGDCHVSNGRVTEDTPDEQAWPCPTVKALKGEK